MFFIYSPSLIIILDQGGSKAVRAAKQGLLRKDAERGRLDFGKGRRDVVIRLVFRFLSGSGLRVHLIGSIPR